MKWFQQKSNIAIGILFLVVFVIVFRHPIEVFPDSIGYLNKHIIRTPGYPLFLETIDSIFGVNYKVALCFIQTSFCCFSIYYFTHKIRSLQLLNEWFSICLMVILLLPLVSGLKIANNILTEAISYGLYLIILAKFISYFCTNKRKEVFFALPLIGLLLITRYQFVFLIPLGLLLISWISFQQKTFKKHGFLIVLFLVLPFITSLIDKTYHKVVHGHFVSTPWTGMSLITPILFVSDAEDVEVLNTPKEKEFFQKTHYELMEQNMNIHTMSIVPLKQSPTLYYIENYANIQMGPIFQNGKEIVGNHMSEEETYIALDKMINTITKPLIWDNFSKWRRIYQGNFIYGLGGSKPALLYFIIAIVSFCMLLKRNDKICKVLFIISLATIANVLLVAIGMHAVIRFTFYNDWVLFLAIFIFLNSLHKKVYES